MRNYKELLNFDIIIILIGTVMFYILFSSEKAVEVLDKEPIIYFLILITAIISTIIYLFGLNLWQIKIIKEKSK